MYAFKKTLQAAAIQGDLDEITRLTNNVKVNEYIGYDYKPVGQFKEPTALTISAAHGHSECVRKILDIGRDIYDVKAFNNDDKECTLLSADYFGAMVLAASECHLEVVQLLAEFRLLKDISDDHPLAEFVNLARKRQFCKFTSLLDSLQDKSVLIGWKGHNLMNLFLLHRCPPSCIRTMIEHRICVNGWDLNGLTPLMCAILGRNLECVRYLLAQGADVYVPHLLRQSHFREDGTVVDYEGHELSPNCHNWSRLSDLQVGFTTLMHAASVKCVPILQMLLEAEPNSIGFCKNNYFELEESTPLMCAIYYGDFESVSLVLKCNESMTTGRNILRLAVSLGKRDVFHLLLQIIAKWNPDHLFSGGLACVMNNDRICLLSLLHMYHKEFDNADAIQLISDAMHFESVDCFKVLLEQACCTDFITAAPLIRQATLKKACERRKYEYVKLLLEYGVDVNYRYRRGRTLVMHAAYRGDVKLLEILLDVHADLDLVDDEKWSAFSCAMLGSTPNGLMVLFKSGKLSDGDRLKAVHQSSFSCISSRLTANMLNSKQLINNILLTMRFNIFEWHWLGYDQNLFKNVIIAAFTLGVCPAKFPFQDQLVCPLHYAVIRSYVTAIQFILENFNFLQDDYQFLFSDTAQKFFDNCPQLTPLYKQLTDQPLPLTAWSFLAISKALVSTSETFLDISTRVDSLNVPEFLKQLLKFEDSFLYLSSHPI